MGVHYAVTADVSSLNRFDGWPIIGQLWCWFISDVGFIVAFTLNGYLDTVCLEPNTWFWELWINRAWQQLPLSISLALTSQRLLQFYSSCVVSTLYTRDFSWSGLLIRSELCFQSDQLYSFIVLHLLSVPKVEGGSTQNHSQMWQKSAFFFFGACCPLFPWNIPVTSESSGMCVWKTAFGGLEKFTATHSVLVYLEINWIPESFVTPFNYRDKAASHKGRYRMRIVDNIVTFYKGFMACCHVTWPQPLIAPLSWEKVQRNLPCIHTSSIKWWKVIFLMFFTASDT